LKLYPLFFVCLFFFSPLVFSQNADCEKTVSFLSKKETQIAHLNLNDPDYIPLHYLVAQDILKELKQFRNDVIPFYSECNEITFSELINKYDTLHSSIQQKYDALARLNNKVYFLFYEKALYEYNLNNNDDGKYYLDRSLQYNATFPNAILLKLNKLLDKNRFEECLTLLNTLYYETEMDDDQEKQAIVFTDKFYDKLYKTGDSLLKIEHAAESLKLFEVLEIFCQNLPTAYCNDDYYHGVLSSKTGIYDSYLAIAVVAEKRGNLQIADRFYQYAQEYLQNNPYLENYEPKQVVVAEKKEPVIEPVFSPVEEELVVEQIVTTVSIPVDISKPVAIEPTPKELKEKYDKIVLQALALCIKEDFSASYSMFLEAKKLENCRCFGTDFRVDLMITELSKILH